MTRRKNIDTPSKEAPEKEVLNISFSEYLWPLAFLLSMTMVGLNFPLGYLLIPVILFNRFRQDRYDFIIMLMLFFGGYAIFDTSNLGGVNNTLFVVVFGYVGLFLFKYPPLLKKIVIAFGAYTVMLIGFALLSEESMKIQMFGIIPYVSFVFYIYPMLAFSGREFDIKILFKHLFPYAIIICIYYWLDSLVMNGHFFIPRDTAAVFFKIYSTFYDPYIAPLSMEFPRKWPLSLFILILCVFPVAKYYKLRTIHWIIVLGALAISRTFTFILGLIIVYFFIKGVGKNFWKYAIASIAVLIALYYVDGLLPMKEEESFGQAQSTLRIKSSIDQIINIGDMQDEEDLAALGSGRMAQIIPKMELLYTMDREWIGFGFLDREMTKSQKYFIENELYTNPEDAIEVAIGVEVAPIQVILNIGYIGLILHLLYFAYTWWVIRKLKYSMYFLSVILIVFIIGISGFSGLIRNYGLYVSGLALAAVILTNKREIGDFDLPPLEKVKQND